MTGPVQPAFVQGAVVNFASHATLAPVLSGVAAGNALILAVSAVPASGYCATTVTDSGGGTWMRGPSVVSGGVGGVEIWYCINAAAGTHTLTVTLNGTSFSGCEFDEFSGVASVAAILDTLGTNNGTSTTPTGPSIVPANVNELLYFASFTGNSVSAQPGAPYSTRNGPTNGANIQGAVAYVAPNNLIAAYQPTWTQTSGAWWVAGIALKGAQPISGAPWNDPNAGLNAGIFTPQARPDYEDWLFDDLAAQGVGVLSGCAVSPNTNADYKFQVAAGTALLGWGPVAVAAATAQNVTAADATNPRRDLIYVTGAGVVTYKAGVAAATPCPPQLPPNCIPLAVIDVPANATVLDNGTGATVAKLIDKRAMLAFPVHTRDFYNMPTAAISETIPRALAGSAAAAFGSTGVLILVQIVCFAGIPIGHLAWVSGTQGAVTPTHWWFSLHDSSYNLLAVTADQTNTAWAANTLMSKAIATTKEGASSSFVPTYTGLYFLGMMMTVGTIINGIGPAQSATLAAFAPILGGPSTSGLTTPPAFPMLANTPAGNTRIPYGYVAA